MSDPAAAPLRPMNRRLRARLGITDDPRACAGAMAGALVASAFIGCATTTPAPAPAPAPVPGGSAGPAAPAAPAEPVPEPGSPEALAAAFPGREIVTYTIQPGDSLWKIADDHKVPVADLRTANAIEGDKILAGTELRIPLPEGVTIASPDEIPPPGEPPPSLGEDGDAPGEPTTVIDVPPVIPPPTPGGDPGNSAPLREP